MQITSCAALALSVLCLTAISASLGGKKDQETPPTAKPIVINGELKADDSKDKKLKDSPAKVHKVKLDKATTYVRARTSTPSCAWRTHRETKSPRTTTAAA
jgi:hypothetical protein